MKEKNILRGTACALLGGVCWGISGTVGQFLLADKGIDTGALTIIRLFGAGIVMLSVAAVRSGKECRALLRNGRDLLHLVIFALFGLMPCQYTYLSAISYSNAATATVLQYTGQALVLLWACLRGRRAPTGRELTALALALGGVFLLSTHGSFTRLYLSPQALLWGMLAALALFLYTTLPGGLLERYETTVCVGYGMLLGGAVLFVLLRAWTMEVHLDLTAMLGVLEIVIVGTALSFTFYLQGVSDLGGVRASLLACVELVCSAVMTALWLKTKFEAADILGMAMILTMAILLTLPSKNNKKDAV